MLLLGLGSVAFSESSGDGGESWTLRADWFDRGNVITGGYADRFPCVYHHGGSDGDWLEYDIAIPERGAYEISVLYAAAESRPVEVLLDGEHVGEKLASTTGSWMTSSAEWKKILEPELSVGTHVLRFQRDSCIPHLCAVRIAPLFPTTVSWSLPRETAREKCLAENIDDNASLPWNVEWFNEVSFDRRKKNESGGAFTDHFAEETALALLPPESVVFRRVENGTTGSTRPNSILTDELTYRRSLFVTDSAAESNAPIYPEVNIRVEWVKNAETAPLPVADGTRFCFTPERYRRLLEKTLEVLDAMENRFGAEELAERGLFAEKIMQTRRYCDEELSQINILLADLIDAMRPDESSKIQGVNGEPAQKNADPQDIHADPRDIFVMKFLRAIRLYSAVTRANPLLDFDEVLFVRRKDSDHGLMQNWTSNSVLNPNGFDDALCALTLPPAGLSESSLDPKNLPTARVIFHPDYPTFLGDLDLNFDGNRLLVSSMGRNRAWNLYALDLKKIESLGASAAHHSTTELMMPLVPPLDEANHYDGCWLADDSMIYTSSACYIAVPCVNGSTRVTNIYRQYADGTIRRLTFDQEHNWCPTVMSDGRILYQRWEYTDTPHAHARLLFSMNPDGTNQAAFYGSNSYWPNAMFYARPIPEEPSKFVAVVGGHHGVPRMGELVLFDVTKGRNEAAGAVQRICGKEKIVASQTNPKYDDTLIVDNLVDEAWPKFVHPMPLSADYYLVAAQPTPDALWGIYLVDTDDNMTLLTQQPGCGCFEPTPKQATDAPPVPVDRVDLSRDDATVFIADLYEGPGLADVPRGTVKSLRLITYNYLFPNVGGPQGTVGAEGPWDIKRVLGTVPVEPSGAALFAVPANTPIAIEPLDENGKAIQLMRSWFTAMPGETLSCVGCHEDANSVSPSGFDPTLMATLTKRSVTPWFGPERGFSFPKEVQPVLDRYCTACHDGEQTDANGETLFDLRGLDRITDYSSVYHSGTKAGRFSTSYDAIHRFIRRPGMESDYHRLMPTEFSVETTDLYKILVKGHYGVRLDAESWDRLVTWIDLNAPYYGTWTEQAEDPVVDHWNERRRMVLELYGGAAPNLEAVSPETFDAAVAARTVATDHSVPPQNPLARVGETSTTEFPPGDAYRVHLQPTPIPTLPNWSFDTPEAILRRRECAERLFGNGDATQKRVKISPEVELVLTLIPPGEFVAGSQSPDKAGHLLFRSPDEIPRKSRVEQPFWLATLETTNHVYELFDPAHDSGVESRYAMQFGVRGFYVNGPELPVVRVSCEAAENFCRWLSDRTGENFRLPTSDEWEWAARAGTTSPFWYGDLDTDFSPFDNLADRTMRELICHPYFKERVPLGGTKYDQWLPRDDRFDDGGFLSEKPGRYAANPWGLFDVHGNVAEWTATEQNGQRIVRGGSWRDRPIHARSESKTFYRPWQGVYNVGFRVVCDIPAKP